MVGDVTADGMADVFVCSATTSWLYRQRHDGTFDSLNHVHPQAHLAAFGYFKADNRIDIASLFRFQGAPDVLLIRMQNSAGGFVLQPSQFLPTYWIHSLEAADLDGDGYDDIAMTGMVYFNDTPWTGTFGVMLNDGTGAFGNAQWALDSYIGYWLTIYDIDRDGDLDAAVSVYDTYSSGGGNLRVDLHFNDGNAQFTRVRPPNLMTYSQFATGQDFADLDGDGVTDMTAGSLDTIDVFRGTESGQNELWQGFVDFANRHLQQPTFGDFNGDGNLDLAYLDAPYYDPPDPNAYLVIIPGTCIHTCPGDANLTGEVDVFDPLELLIN